MNQQKKLVEYVKKTVKPVSGVVASSKDLQTKCLKQNACVVILHAGKLEYRQTKELTTLLTKHRLASFVRVDTTKRKLSIESKLPETKDLDPEDSETRLVLLKRVKTKEGKTHWFAKGQHSRFAEDYVSSFLEDYDYGGKTNKADMVTLKTAPYIEARGKKLTPEEIEEKEAKKAARKAKRKARKAKIAREKAKQKAAKEKEERDEKDNKDQSPEEAERQREQRRRQQMDEEQKDSFAFVEEVDEEEVDLDDDVDDYDDDDDDEEISLDEDEEVESGDEDGQPTHDEV